MLKNKIIRFFCEKKDLIPGGFADNKTISDIAEKHAGKTSGEKYDDMLKSIKIQLDKGVDVEMEHVDDTELAREIALDHLWEIPDYYDRLADMEDKAGN